LVTSVVSVPSGVFVVTDPSEFFVTVVPSALRVDVDFDPSG